MSLYIQRSSFRLSANYILNNVLRALRVKLLFENSLCYSIKWILCLGNESDFYLSGNNVPEVKILELMYEISTYCLWPLKPFSVPFGAPAQSDYFQSLGFCPSISLAGFGLSLQVSLWASGTPQATRFFSQLHRLMQNMFLWLIQSVVRAFQPHFSPPRFLIEIHASFLLFSVMNTIFGNTALEKLRSPCCELQQGNTAHIKYYCCWRKETCASRTHHFELSCNWMHS